MYAPKRVLFITYPFPPVGGAGVQRTTKFVKYLGEFGWTASVLTVANPSVPAFDTSLVNDIPPDIEVRRARTWEPSYAMKSVVSANANATPRASGGLRAAAKGFLRGLTKLLLQPDPQILWVPNAIREGQRLLSEFPTDAIVASGPPFSTFLIGASLSRRTGIPLVLDYRDEWDLSNAYRENQKGNSLSLFIQRRMQTSLLRSARAVLATTQASVQALKRLCQVARSRARVACIYNGFDPNDFREPIAQPKKKDTYRLVYTGTLWNLTSVEPLVEAVHDLARRSPQLLQRLELVFAGRRTASQQQILERLSGLPCRLEEHPYVDHSQALNLVRTADGLLALLSDLPDAGRVVPAKIFEYMAAQRPILAIAPDGELWDILKTNPLAGCRLPSDRAGISQWLEQELCRVQDFVTVTTGGGDHSSFSRRAQTGELVEILQALGKETAVRTQPQTDPRPQLTSGMLATVS